MNKLSILVVALILAGCSIEPPSPIEPLLKSDVAKIINYAKKDALNPDSLQIRSGFKQDTHFEVEINGENAFGGKTGFQCYTGFFDKSGDIGFMTADRIGLACGQNLPTK